MGRISNWLSRITGWPHLAFADRLKLLAFIAQWIGALVMTGFAFHAMRWLATKDAIWPVFYLGAAAMLILGGIITGFGTMLYKRNLELEAFGVKLKSGDTETATAIMKEAQSVQRTD